MSVPAEETDGKPKGDGHKKLTLQGGKHSSTKKKHAFVIRCYPVPYQNGKRCDPDVWRSGHVDCVWEDFEFDGEMYEPDIVAGVARCIGEAP